MAFAELLPLLGEAIQGSGVASAGAAVSGGGGATSAQLSSMTQAVSSNSQSIQQASQAIRGGSEQSISQAGEMAAQKGNELQQAGEATRKHDGSGETSGVMKEATKGLANFLTGASIPGIAAGGGSMAVDAYSKASKAMEAWTDALIQSQYNLEEWNGQISVANARMMYQHNLQDIERGQSTGESYSRLTESKTSNEQSWLRIETMITAVSNNAASAWNDLEGYLGTIVTQALFLQQIWEYFHGKDENEGMPLGIFLHEYGQKEKNTAWQGNNDAPPDWRAKERT